ncbi:hypothetical protein NDU88_006862 [Pleurodeles waltl]|uniref:Uncharacterized protein n=1 Tax=Pleurodeles waltl TaxID=8319 RepID=A0AAV7QIZ2_PLEWA|nr:hypothetical protein NDU88_006862 [Pleurodeles waltl]
MCATSVFLGKALNTRLCWVAHDESVREDESCDPAISRQDRTDVAERPVAAVGGKQHLRSPDGCDKTPGAAAAAERSWWQRKEPAKSGKKSTHERRYRRGHMGSPHTNNVLTPKAP